MGEAKDLGRVVGLSAYEVGVKNGFEGTEAEWLKSLKGPNGSDFHVYSDTDEKIVGQWHDGRPIYEKLLFKQGRPPGSTMDLSSLNIKEIISIQLYQYDNAIFKHDITPSFNNSTKILYFNDAYNKWCSYCYIYYTKLTDTGSAKISPIQHNYSTEEQIVGTWINGKPIYEKTIITEPFNLIANQWTDIQESTVGKEDPISCFCVADGDLYLPCLLSLNRKNANAKIWPTRNTNVDNARIITIQYTKSTD